MISIFVYSPYGSDVYTMKPSVALAVDEALRISALEPANVFEVVIEPGDWHNPVFRNGIQTSGAPQ